MLRRILIGVGLLIAVPVVAASAWVLTHRSDLASPGDQDLEIPLSDLAIDRNGHEHLKAVHRLARLPEGWEDRVTDLDVRNAEDVRWLEALLERNRGAFAELERFIAAPSSVFPVFEPDDANGERDDGSFTAMSLARLAAEKARLASSRGQTRTAIDAALLGVRAGAAFGRVENPVLVDLMLAVSMQRRGVLALEETTRSAPLSQKQALALVRELESDRIPADAWRRMWAGEYQFVKATLEAVRDDPTRADDRGLMRILPRDFAYQHNRTLSLYAARTRHIMQGYAESCAAASESPEDRPALLMQMLRGNPVGVVVAAMPQPSFEKFNVRRCAGDARLSILEAAIAARTATRLRGAPPESLAALVPELLDAIPRDAFDGEPIRYDAHLATISSIGSDLRLDGAVGPLWLGADDEPGTYVR